MIECDKLDRNGSKNHVTRPSLRGILIYVPWEASAHEFREKEPSILITNMKRPSVTWKSVSRFFLSAIVAAGPLLLFSACVGPSYRHDYRVDNRIDNRYDRHELRKERRDDRWD